MPEGPETHYIADRLAEVLIGKPLLRVAFSSAELVQYQRKLTGRKVDAVDARGKALLTRFDDGLTLYTHNQLLGYWNIGPTRPIDPNATVPRVLLVTRDKTATLHIAPKVEIWKTADIETHPFLQKLGPDVLAADAQPQNFVAQLRSPRFHSKKLSVLLLDQSFAAGMGNYLRSEVLFEAKLTPLRRPIDLDETETLRLARALIDVPRRSYRSKFKAGLPASTKDYLADTKKTFRFRVFDREGLPCPSCDGKIVQERLASRRFYWCPSCQH
ncbi:MAG: endonuclease VIII [Luteimonas sp.]